MHSIRNDLAEGLLMYLLETHTLTTSILDKIDEKFIRKRMRKWRVLVFAWSFLLLILSHRGVAFPAIICPRIVRVCNVLSVHKYLKNFSSPCFNLRSKLFRTNEGEKASLLHSPFLLSPQLSRGNARRQVTQASKS